MKVGDWVKTWWDTGAMGSQIMFGRVEQAGPIKFTVRWPSGIKNRLSQDTEAVKKCDERESENARAEFLRLGV